MTEPKQKRMKHNYTDELELKSLIIRVNNRKEIEGSESKEVDDSPESIAKNHLINRYISLYKKIKAVKTTKPNRKIRLRETRKRLKDIIIEQSVNTTIDQKSFEVFGSIVLLMIKSILTKPSFAKMGYDAEFYSDSVYKISKYIHNFDHTKISERTGLPGNAFAYVSQYIHNAFLFICNKKRDERKNHIKQVNMELLDDNYQYKQDDLLVDDRTKHHQNENIVTETVTIAKINDGETLIDHIKKIAEHAKEWSINVDKFEIIYPESYRITFDEFNEMKPLLDGTFTITRERLPEPKDEIDDEFEETDDE